MAATNQLAQRDSDAPPNQAREQNAPGDGAGAGRRPTKAYDFRKPDKFSKDHLRGLRTIFESYARLVILDLSGLLRTQVQVRLSSVEQTPYEDYTAQLPNPTALGIVSGAPLPDRFIFELSLPVSYVIFDRLLGGSGRGLDWEREITDIEASLIRLVIQRMLPALDAALAGIAEVQSQLEDLVFGTAYLPAAVPGTAAILAVLEVELLGVTGTISLAERLVVNFERFQTLAETDAAQVAHLERMCVGPHFWRAVPAFELDIHDLSGLARVNRYLFDSQKGPDDP